MHDQELEKNSGKCKAPSVTKNNMFTRKNLWENESGGLSDAALAILKQICKELEKTEFAVHVNSKMHLSGVNSSDFCKKY